LTSQVFGFETKVEPNPLNLVEEVKARIEGRKIFQTFGTVEPILVRRSMWHIANIDPHTKVLVAHDCKRPTYFEPQPLFESQVSTHSEGAPF
jgi:hypothetical protein